MITQKVSTTDPDSGWFHKGEHKQVFAYAANTCCDKNNYVLDFEVTAGNVHDSVSFLAFIPTIKAELEIWDILRNGCRI